MLRFLRICNPLDNPDYFRRLLLRPLKAGDPAGTELLRVRWHYLFRRSTYLVYTGAYGAYMYSPYQRGMLCPSQTNFLVLIIKQMQDSEGNYLVPLPPVEMTMVPVTLHPEARVSR
jgi:SWI/SNF-related matrix-associated actin-dependent regulator of chromatin subfamily A3